MSEKRRLDLDLLRAWLCTAVMLVHVFGQVIPKYAFVGMQDYTFSTVLAILNTAVNLTVPGFVFLSGYFVTYRRPNFQAAAFIKSRLKSTLPLYSLFTIIYVLYYYRSAGIWSIPQHLFAGTACYQLYFIPIIVQLYLLTPFFVAWMQRYPRYLLSLALLISFGFSVANYLTYPFLAGYFWFVPYLIYYIWGIVAGQRPEPRLSKRRLVLGAVAYLLLATVVALLDHWAAYLAIFIAPPMWHNVLIIALNYLRNLLGLLLLRALCLRAAELIAPHPRLIQLSSLAAAQSYLVYLAHPMLLGLLARFVVNDSWRLFFIFPPLAWLLALLYAKIRRYCSRSGSDTA